MEVLVDGDSLIRDLFDTTYRVIIVCYFANEILEKSVSNGSCQLSISQLLLNYRK